MARYTVTMPQEELSKALGSHIMAMLAAGMPVPVGAEVLEKMQRWITVHPHGNDETGIPVMIEDQGNGKGHIVSGAGGKLNFMKLTNLKTPEELKAAAKEKRKSAPVTPTENQDAMREKRMGFVRDMAPKVGLSNWELDPKKIAHLSEGAQKLTTGRHYRRVEKEIRKAIGEVKRGIALDLERRHEVGMDELPLVSKDEDVVALADLEGDVTKTRGLGYSRETKEKALEHGKPEEQKQFEAVVQSGDMDKARTAIADLADRVESFDTPKAKHEADKLRAVATLPDEEFKEQAVVAHDAGLVRTEAEHVKAERLAMLDHPELALNMEVLMDRMVQEARIGKQIAVAGGMEREERTYSPEEQIALLKEEKKYRMEMKSLRGEPAGASDKGGFRVDFSEEEVDKAVVEDIKNRVMAMRNTSFLEDVQKAETTSFGEETKDPLSMERYYSEGAYNSVNRLAMNVAGGELLDRHAVDTLGLETCARALARNIHKSKSADEVKDILSGLEEFHVAEQSERVEESQREANEAMEFAKEIELGAIENPVDLLVAEELNEKRRDALMKARGILGRTLGEFEATAALIMALREKPRDSATLELGDKAVDSAIREAHSLGLLSGEDYDISNLPEDTKKMTVNAHGMDKLIRKPDPERAALYKDMQAIKTGALDDENWVPSGMSRRRIDPQSIPALPAMSFSEDLNLEKVTDPAQVSQSVNDYMLGRFNDGQSIGSMRSDLLSSEFAIQHGITDKNADSWVKAVDESLPQIYASDYAHEKTAALRGPDGHVLPGMEAEHRKQWNLAIREAADKNKVLDEQVKTRLLNSSAAFAAREAERTGRAIPALHEQEIDVHEPDTREAAFRAVASHPGGHAAFKAVGELDRADRSLLRRHFTETFAKGQDVKEEAPAAGKDAKPSPAKQWNDLGKQHGPKVYSAIQDMLKAKPKQGLFGAETLPIATVNLEEPKELAELFAGELGISKPALMAGLDNPKYKEQLVGELKNAAQESLRASYFRDVLGYSEESYRKYQENAHAQHGKAWENYVMMMGGEKQAYQALQEDIRGDVVNEFARQHNALSGKAMKTAPVELTGRDKHLKGTLPPEKVRDMAAKEQAKRAKELALAAERNRGKFAPGERSERADAIREALKRSGQRSIFRTADEATAGNPRDDGRRWSIGDRAEAQLGGVIKDVTRSMPYGQHLKLWSVSLGGNNIRQQRAIRALERGKRVVFAQGVGTGKTVMALGGFAHLHSQGKVKRALFAVPSIVQGQFGGEAARYLEPGQFTVHANPGESKEERMAAYRNPQNHITVVTHQALRDDTIEMVQKNLGMSQERFDAMGRKERAAAVREAFTKEGIDVQQMVLDEGHDALNRRGKEDSTLAHVMDAIADNVDYYTPMTADPLKNDTSEIFDWLTKIDANRYPPESRNDFLAKYGNNTVGSREALQREIAPFFYSGKADIASRAHKHVEKLPLGPEQGKAYEHVHELYNRARAARSKGQVDLDALKELSPVSFEGVEPDKQAQTAQWLSNSLGMLREAALSRVVNTSGGDNVKVKRSVELALKGKAEGKPGVVFAHNRESVKLLKAGFEKAGLKVGIITGASSAKEKEAVKLGFNPEDGAPKYDVLLCSDAGATGMNAQTGKWLINYDTPDTAKGHNQRIGRIHRIGQNSDVDVYDLVSDTRHEAARRDRLQRKYALGEVFQSPLEALDDSGLSHFIQKARAGREQGKVIPLGDMAGMSKAAEPKGDYAEAQ